MTCKELLYVEDALGHESIMKNCACKTSSDLKDVSLSSYIKELETMIYLTNLKIYYKKGFQQNGR